MIIITAYLLPNLLPKEATTRLHIINHHFQIILKDQMSFSQL